MCAHRQRRHRKYGMAGGVQNMKVTVPASVPDGVAPGASVTAAFRCSVEPAESGLALVLSAVAVVICAMVCGKGVEALTALFVSPL